MGVTVSSSLQESQDRRLKIKTLDQRMIRTAIDGTGLSAWEAKVLIDAIGEVYFSDPELKEMAHGQLKYSCVSAGEGAGKPLDKCAMTTVLLTLLDPEDRQELTRGKKCSATELRQRRILRMTEEAREQNGLLTQEDLAAILNTDVRTVRRDIVELRKREITVATRGQQQDIGPGVSHRGLAVRLWFDGKEPVEISRQIKHSIKAVENYLEKFKRVAYLRNRAFDDYQIALTVGMSVSAVRTYTEICHVMQNRPFYKNRLAEINLVGEQHYLACDEKKDSSLLKESGRKVRMQ